MRVCVEQTAVDLLVVLVVINFRQPSAISHRAKYNTGSLTSLIPLCRAAGPRQTAGPPALSLVCPICTPAMHCVSQLCKFILICQPNASMDIIKIRHLFGEPLGKYTCPLILSQACGLIPPPSRSSLLACLRTVSDWNM